MLLLAGAIILGSCEVLSDMKTVDFDGTFSETFQINLEEGQTSFSEVKTIEVTDDSEIEKYKGNLEKFTIKKIKIKIIAYSGPESLVVNGQVKYSSLGGTPMDAASISKLDVPGLYNSVEELELIILEEAVKNFENLLMSDQIFDLYLSGNSSSSPAQLTVKLIVDVKVKAKVL